MKFSRHRRQSRGAPANAGESRDGHMHGYGVFSVKPRGQSGQPKQNEAVPRNPKPRHHQERREASARPHQPKPQHYPQPRHAQRTAEPVTISANLVLHRATHKQSGEAAITFLGGAREVGRSCILVEDGEKILLDCGIKLEEDEAYPLLDARTIRALNKVVLSHAHIDHSAYLPYLYTAGYRGKVVMTKPTRDLIQLLLADYLRINQNLSPYKEEDVKKLLTNAQLQEYGEEKAGVTLHEAGHILGSAVTELKTRRHKIIYSGDINLRPSRLLEEAKTGYDADTLIIESTYGGRNDFIPSIKESGKELIESINETFRKGGKVIIPTFAIGRGQEILFTIESYMRSKTMPETPIYLDGMIKKALKIYRHNAIYLKKEIQHRILTSDDDPFKSEHYRIPETKTREDVFQQDRAIILSTSGMLNGGPVLTYIKALGQDRKNKIILVGFQAAGTRGRLLLQGVDELEIDDEMVPINLEVDETKFSGHSDHNELLEFAKSVRGLKTVFVVHGEEEKSEELAQDLRRMLKKVNVIVPKIGETHPL